jgi:hypothetical protein
LQNQRDWLAEKPSWPDFDISCAKKNSEKKKEFEWISVRRGERKKLSHQKQRRENILILF